MRGAGYYYCSACLSEQPFYGALAGDTETHLGLIRHMLQTAFFRPVCVRCGSKVIWEAQKFLAQGAYNDKEELVVSNKEPKITANLLETRCCAGGADRGIEHQGFNVANSQEEKAVNGEYRLEWNDKGLGRQGNVVDASGQVVGQVRTTLDYVFGSQLLSNGTIVVAQRRAVRLGSDGNWIEIFQKPKSLSRRDNVPRWKKIASVPFGTGIRDLSFNELRTRDAVLFVNTEGVALIDAEIPTRSKIFLQHDLLGYCRPGAEIIDSRLSEGEALLFLEYLEWQEPLGYRNGLLAVDLVGNAKPIDLGSAEQRSTFDERAGYIVTTMNGRLLVYANGRWRDPLNIECSEEIIAVRLSADGDHLIAKVKTDSHKSDENSDTFYKIWELI